jgi:3-hydroxyisobutyrate dehydrogenase-like beta-hydroxyacid dehydrogenase
MAAEDISMGLVGVGLLGSAIAERLASAGMHVVAFDTDPSRVNAVASSWITPAATLAEVATRCDRIVLSLPTSEIVAGVVEGTGGLVEGLKRGSVIIDTTTGDPESSAGLARRLSERGITFLDATVAGSSDQLRRREVAVLVGGAEDAFDTCRDIFAAWSDRVFHTGPSGSGARTKLLVNQVLGLNRLVLAEALALAGACGVDPARLLEILRATPAYSRVMDTKGAKMVTGDFTPQARLAQHRKDVGLILELARRAGMDLPVSELHARLLDAAIEAGWGDLDNSAILRVFAKTSGKT